MRELPEPEDVELAELPVYMTREEAWTFLRVSESTLDRMLDAGELERRRVRGRVVIPRASVRAYVLGSHNDNGRR